MNKAFTALVLVTTAATLSAQTNTANLETNRPAPTRNQVFSLHTRDAIPHPNLTVVTTNHVLLSGTLISQSQSNLVLSSQGMTISIPLGQIKWCETNLVNVAGSPVAGEKVSAAPPKSTSSAAIIAEFNKPHSESEMRTLLQTPEAQALVKSIADAYIGTGTDAQTKAAKESYFNSVLQFQSGSLGILEIQEQASGVLGQLGQFDKELSNDPLAEEWKEYREILQGFLAEPAPAEPAKGVVQ